MRSQQFFERLNQFGDFRKATVFASEQVVNGGWEVWMQVEIAYAFSQTLTDVDRFVFEREKTYPDEDKRCDFYMGINGAAGDLDPTYMELKCINPFDLEPSKSAIVRYLVDIKKAVDVGQFVACLLVYCGNWRHVINWIKDNRGDYVRIIKDAVVYEIGNDGKFYSFDVNRDLQGHNGVFMFYIDIGPQLPVGADEYPDLMLFQE